MDDALRQKITELRNESTHENIIKLTEEIFQKTEDFIPNEVVISKDGEKYKILNKNEETYRCAKLQNDEVLTFKREELSRILPLTRNDVRRIILTAPRPSPNPMSPNIMSPNPMSPKVGLPPNVKINKINNTNLAHPILKIEEARPMEKMIKTEREIEFPELIPLEIPFINPNEKIGNKNLQKIYLRIFTFLEIYNEYFEIEKLTFEEFDNMLLDFQKCINVLSKIFSALISEKKTKKKKFYVPIENLYKIFFKDFKEENEIKRKEKYIWFTKKISTNNYAEYIASFIEDINSEIQTKNILNFKNISKNYTLTFQTNEATETTQVELKETTQTEVSEIKESINEIKEKFEIKESINEIKELSENKKELSKSIKNRLQILFYFVELFGETTEAKILNENIGAFNRECLKQRNTLLFEIQKLKNKILETPNKIIGEESNKIMQEIFKKKKNVKKSKYRNFMRDIILF